MLSITDGFHVPVMPLLEVADNVGGVLPAQKGAIRLKLGVNKGFDRIIPVLSSVMQPLISNSKFE
jgi:hypothetical protein